MSDELNIAKKKLLAIRRAERRLIHRLEDIEWEERVLKPEIQRLALEAVTNAELPQFSIIETSYEDILG